MTAQAVLALYDSEILLKTSDVASSLTMEALHGIPDSLDERVHALQAHRSQMLVASNLQAAVWKRFGVW